MLIGTVSNEGALIKVGDVYIFTGKLRYCNDELNFLIKGDGIYIKRKDEEFKYDGGLIFMDFKREDFYILYYSDTDNRFKLEYLDELTNSNYKEQIRKIITVFQNLS